MLDSKLTKFFCGCILKKIAEFKKFEYKKKKSCDFNWPTTQENEQFLEG